MIHKIEIPDYSSRESSDKPKIEISEFAGRCCITVSKNSTCMLLEVDFDDLLRAWNAVKKY